MLYVTVKPHRAFLRSDAGPQKLFVMLKLLPAAEALLTRPPVHLAVVVDTSGSMNRSTRVAGGGESVRTSESLREQMEGPSKIQRAMAAARALLTSELLQPDDYVSLIHFDDESRVLASGKVGASRQALLEGVAALEHRRGGTWMGAGLRHAERELGAQAGPSRKVLLLTDGQAADADGCKKIALRLASLGAPIAAVGLGAAYNEELLTELSALSLGTPYHLSDDTALNEILDKEVGAATRLAITGTHATVQPGPGARIMEAHRVYPTLAEIEPTGTTLALGNLEAGDHTIFLVELEVLPQSPGRAHLGHVSLIYRSVESDSGGVGEWGPFALHAEFSADDALAAQVDSEVMSYVEQRSVNQLIQRAARDAATNPAGASRALKVAHTISQRVGNHGMTYTLRVAEQELLASGAISPETLKTIKVGSRSQTIKPPVAGPGGAARHDALGEEEIRRLSGA